MFRRRFMGGLLALLLIVGGLSLIGRMSYSRGWTDGYFSGQQVETTGEDGTETAVPPTTNYRHYPYRGWGYSPFTSIIGGIFKFWLFFMLIGLAFKMLFFRRWRRGGRHWHGPLWHGHHGHKPPWAGGPCGQDDEPYEKSPEDVEPDIRSA